jgi:hypothetical protein
MHHTLFLITLLALLLPLHAAADDIDEAANAAAQAEWLAEAAARYRTGEHAGLPLYTAQFEEELPSPVEYEERSNMCSYYCCAPGFELSASSELPASGELAYDVNLLDDFILSSAWVEGAEGSGEGESFSFLLHSAGDSMFDGQYLNGLDFVNGYVKNADLFQANACPTLLKLWFDGEAVCCVRLQDSMDLQAVQFAPMFLSSASDHVLKLEILEVRKGTRFADMAITDVQLRGGPCH